MKHATYVGTAGWTLPRDVQDRFAGAGSHLERYARVFDAAEINSTFHRAHRRSTYERWAASVPASFRFSAKLPKAITHAQRLAGTEGAVETFLGEIAPLAAKLGCLLVQLPPSLAFDAKVARAFFAHLRASFDGGLAVEPRHPSWFVPACDRLLEKSRVARVVADPLKSSEGAEPGGWKGLAYFRLHGSPRVYYSSYDDAFLESLGQRLRAVARHAECWCIFDNTTLGAGTANALALRAMLASR